MLPPVPGRISKFRPLRRGFQFFARYGEDSDVRWQVAPERRRSTPRDLGRNSSRPERAPMREQRVADLASEVKRRIVAVLVDRIGELTRCMHTEVGPIRRATRSAPCARLRPPRWTAGSLLKLLCSSLCVLLPLVKRHSSSQKKGMRRPRRTRAITAAFA